MNGTVPAAEIPHTNTGTHAMTPAVLRSTVRCTGLFLSFFLLCTVPETSLTMRSVVVSQAQGSGWDCHWVTHEETEALMCLAMLGLDFTNSVVAFLG